MGKQVGPRTLVSKPFPGVTKEAKTKGLRVILHAPPKWGKTSFASYLPNPVFLMTRGEDGLATLIKSKEISPVDHFEDEADTWEHVMAAISSLITENHNFKWLVIDTLNGVEMIGHEHTCGTKFDGQWDKFDSYGRGQATFSKDEFNKIMSLLEELREKNVNIMLLCHSQIKLFANPEGVDYDRWETALSKQVRARVDRWVDAIMFGNTQTVVKKKNKVDAKGKAEGGSERIICTQLDSAYDAGNRLGLADYIQCGSSAEEACQNFLRALEKKS